MQLNQSTEYALSGLAYLAKTARDRSVFISEISKDQGASESYMGKIFQSLTRVGIVKSSRGVKGGFSLAKDPKDITFLQVIEAIEGPLAFSRCSIIGKGCPNYKACKLRPVISDIQKKVEKIISEKTIESLLNHK